MKNLNVKSLSFPEVKVLRFERHLDERGYFTEHFRRSDFEKNEKISFFKNLDFVQSNESYSQAGTVRGLHFQWNPYMGKLVRTIQGQMTDMILDIRPRSPNFGKIIAYDMPSRTSDSFDEWIWVPVGFAHGNFYSEETIIEYFCTGEYNPQCEAGISPLAEDIDWSECDKKLKEKFDSLVKTNMRISGKDRHGLTMAQWKKDPRSENFEGLSTL